MKKVAIFSANYFPHLGGVERYTYNVAKKLNDMGYKIYIVTCNYNGALKRKETTEIATIYRVPNYKIFSSRYPINKKNKESKQIFKELENEKIDYAIIQTRFWVMSYVASKFVHKNNIPSFLIEHGSAHFTVYNKILDFFGERYEHAITKSIKNRINNYYGVSNRCNEWLTHFGIEAKGVLYNSIDTEIKQKYQNKINKDNGKIKITFIGRMIEEKGVTKLIDAFKDLETSHTNIELYLAGDGPIYERIKSENKENKRIHVLGSLDHNGVLELLAETSIFVNPSNFAEGLPTTILEAGLLECAIIATPMGGTTEVISNESLGLICKSETNDIKEKIKILLQDKNRIESLGKNISSRIQAQFSWDNTAKKIKEIIEKEVQ